MESTDPAEEAEAGSLSNEEAPLEGRPMQAMPTRPALCGTGARGEGGMEMKGRSQGRNET